jgi:hypothetical protein
MSIELSPDYYLLNFKALVKFVVEQYEDLISNAEREFIRRFQMLSADAAKLFVRLCLRTKACYFSEQLVYQEISSIDGAIEELNKNEFVLINPSMEGVDLLNVLTKDDLKSLFTDKSIKGSLKKELLIENILSIYSIKKIHEIIFKAKLLVYKNKETEVEALLHFFFGNRFQNLTEFILQDLGFVTYEKYSLDKNSRLFSNRLDFEHSIILGQLSEESYLAVEAEDIEAVVAVVKRIPVISSNRKLNSQKGKVLNRCAAYLEKNKLIEEALLLYQQTDRIPSRERQARILNTLSRKEESIKLCEQILEDSFSEDEKEFAEAFLHKLKTNKNKVKTEQSIFKEILILENHNEKSVEQISLEFLQSSYHSVHFVENTLMNSLFGLWFWEEIFAPMQGAFCHPFQFGPLDLFTDDFFQARKSAILIKIDQLKGEAEMVKNNFLKKYETKFGIANHLVYWEMISKEMIEAALVCIPFQHIEVIFNRMLLGLKENSSGFPDLIAFSKDLKNYEMIEIKGPGDKLQKNQTRWFQFFKQNQIPCRLIHVEWK